MTARWGVMETGTAAAAADPRACTEYSSRNRWPSQWKGCRKGSRYGTKGLVDPSTNHPWSLYISLPPRFLSYAFPRALFDPGFRRTKPLPYCFPFCCIIICFITFYHFGLVWFQVCHIICTATMLSIIIKTIFWFRYAVSCMQWQCSSRPKFISLALGLSISYHYHGISLCSAVVVKDLQFALKFCPFSPLSHFASVTNRTHAK